MPIRNRLFCVLVIADTQDVSYIWYHTGVLIPFLSHALLYVACRFIMPGGAHGGFKLGHPSALQGRVTLFAVRDHRPAPESVAA